MINRIYTTIFSDKLDELRLFYTKYFDARISYDNGWYITFRFANDDVILNFMAPQNNDQVIFNGIGISIDMRVKSADDVYNSLKEKGFEITAEIEDHPWGDRAFIISDPAGVRLYIYEEK